MGTELFTGIVDQGTETTLICKTCNEPFKTKINVITIKGKSPDPKLCSICYKKQQEYMK